MVASSPVSGVAFVTLFVFILGMMSPTYSSAQTIVSVSKEFQTPDIKLNESTVKGDDRSEPQVEEEKPTVKEEEEPTVEDGDEPETQGEDEVNVPDENETTNQENDTESEEQPVATISRKKVEGGLDLAPGIQAPYKVKVTFDSITVHHDHDGSTSGDGEWKLVAYVQGKKVDLTSASGPGAGLNDVSDGETVKFKPGTEVTVDIPYPLPLSIFVLGEEVDCDNPPFPDDASEKVISILKGPDTREKMLENIWKYIFFLPKDYDYRCSAGFRSNTELGWEIKIYEPIGYGAGAHTAVSDMGYLCQLHYPGLHPGDPPIQVPCEVSDYTLRYTISVTAPPPPDTAPPPTIKPETTSGTCDNNLPVSGVTSSASQSTFPPTNAIDDKLNTKWWSTFIVKPFITLDLGGLKSVCSVDIAWADGNSHPYLFDVSVSTDGNSFTKVLSGTSTGTTTSPEKYTFPETQARYVKITITQSVAGSANSIGQISEIDLFGLLNAESQTTPIKICIPVTPKCLLGLNSTPEVKTNSTSGKFCFPTDIKCLIKLNSTSEVETVAPTEDRFCKPGTGMGTDKDCVPCDPGDLVGCARTSGPLDTPEAASEESNDTGGSKDIPELSEDFGGLEFADNATQPELQ